jgi:hypothetical protein
VCCDVIKRGGGVWITNQGTGGSSACSAAVNLTVTYGRDI